MTTEETTLCLIAAMLRHMTIPDVERAIADTRRLQTELLRPPTKRALIEHLAAPLRLGGES